MPRFTDHPYWPDSQVDTEPDPHAELCSGFCNAGYRAAEARVRLHGGEHDYEPRPGEPVWCLPCVTDLRGDLGDWPDLADRLQEEIGSGVRALGGEYVSGSKNRPIHEHEAPSLLLDEAAEWLPEWAATIARDRALPERQGARRTADPVAAITDACAFLRIHLDWHLNGRNEEQWEASQDFGIELARLTRKARTLTGSDKPEPVRVIGVPCPHCDRKALEHEIEESATRRVTASRYTYGDDGDVRTERRPATDEEAAALRLRPPRKTNGEPVDAWEPTLPHRVTAPAATSAEGAITGYIRCRRCKPTFSMTMDEYHRWTRMRAAGEQVRAMATADKLREVFGNSIPAQYKGNQ